ncbi:hypothetical protein ACFWNI_00275 [Streptomyces sp. NPDC058377]|uniref:hypothetical protein n=1 Tax=Streptomyces sp. NPDC058377 TaxID=3346468 RepID=UPI003658CFFB
MPEPTAQAPTPTTSRSRSSVLAILGCVSAALAVACVLVAQLAWGSTTDFPRIAPEEMADRAFQRSQEAYDVMGFTRIVEPGVEDIGVSTENTLGSGYCYGGGLFSLDETVDGAYRMSHRWALDRVPAGRAVPGLRRLHQHFKENGWEVTSYREGGAAGDWDLFVQRDGGGERMSFTWFPDREYFMGGATGPCASDPGWEDGDVSPSGDGLWPPVLGPAQRN